MTSKTYTTGNISFPSGVEIEMAVMSVDVARFSGLPENVRPKLVHALQEFVNGPLKELIVGVVPRDIGDGFILATTDPGTLPIILSHLQGALRIVASGFAPDKPPPRLRAGASYGKVTLLYSRNGTTNVGGDNAIIRATRIEAANTAAQGLWVDEAMVAALSRRGSRVSISYGGEHPVGKSVAKDKEGEPIPEFGVQKVWTVSEVPASLNLYKDLVCYHQGQIPQYWSRASWKHREFKAASQGNEPPEIIRKHLHDLEHYLVKSLVDVARHTFDFVQNRYFSERLGEFGGIKPRLCIKVFSEMGGRTVNDAVREDGVVSTDPVAVEANSGFHHVAQHGTPFLSNDLAADVTGPRQYRNPRFDDIKIRALVNKFKKSPTRTVDDQEWQACWKSGAANLQSCYRSTLIIPMTLKNNESLDDEFRDRLSAVHGERLIFGVLCIDHPKAHFFRNEDVAFGYVIADLLSIYLLAQSNFTQASATVRANRPSITAAKGGSVSGRQRKV